LSSAAQVDSGNRIYKLQTERLLAVAGGWLEWFDRRGQR
jgi:hypothetical protein